MTRQLSIHSEAFNKVVGSVCFWIYDVETVFHTADLSIKSVGDFVASWNSYFHTVFNAAEHLSNHRVVF